MRSQIIAGRLAGRGAMMSVALSRQEAERRIGGRLEIAVVNSPGSVVVCGEAVVVEQVRAELVAQQVRVRVIPVDYASHSSYVEDVRLEVLEALAGVRPRASSVAFYSTVSGGLVDTSGLDGGYWYANLRQEVRFEEATRRLLADGVGVFVEVSPHPGLVMAVQDTADGVGVAVSVVETLRRGEGGRGRLLASLAQAFVCGVPVVFDFPGGRRVEVPTYAFQRERYWMVASSAGDVEAAGLSVVRHPLLSAAVPSP
ncbi:acyltransferase domain-containing protein, partial [Streptosporangium sp. DT93]|uniref:acyltransferase domain-containing protein n=1 Tax=Streptosporangium sp. DT93 TaxID=3393428 RepID=UPI003CEA5AFE